MVDLGRLESTDRPHVLWRISEYWVSAIMNARSVWLDVPSSPGAVQAQRVKWAQNMTAPVNIK